MTTHRRKHYLTDTLQPLSFRTDDDAYPEALGRGAMDIDENGSPVTLPEADWLVCFVPGLRRQWWHRFAHKEHKHVFAIRKLDNDAWLLVEPWWTRLMVNVLTHDQAIKFLQWGADGDVLKVRERIPGQGCQMRGWSNCAVLVAFLLGRSYWTWTPHGLYRRLRADRGVQSVDAAYIFSEYFRSMRDESLRSTLKTSFLLQ